MVEEVHAIVEESVKVVATEVVVQANASVVEPVVAASVEEVKGTTEQQGQEKEPEATVEAPKAAPLKRQLTLMEMMSGKNASSAQPSKKTKITASGSMSNRSSIITVADKGNKPKATTFGLQPLNSIPFSLSDFQSKLPEDHRRLLRLECETMGKSWLKLLKDEITKSYFLDLKRFLWEEGVRGPDDSPTPTKVYPLPKNIYTWTNAPLGRIRVVIIGQDPYHGPGQAHGLCFSVPQGVAVPPSLKNIYQEIKAEYPEFVIPKHGNLTKWAENGVLLLNTALTVRAGQAGSHSNKGWEQFTDKVVDIVDKYGGASLPINGSPAKTGIGKGVVFLAWGAWALKRVAKLDKGKHLILSSAHPSPLSAHRGFLGNGHFKAANRWLEAKYGKEGIMDWCTLD